MKHLLETVLLGGAVALLIGCSAEENVPRSSLDTRLEIRPILESHAGSRAAAGPDGSYAAFEKGDVCGFFSEYGGNGTAGYDNLEMTYNDGVFSCSEFVDMNGMGRTFAYFPYNPDMTRGIDVRNPDGSVIDLLAGAEGRYIPQQGYTVPFVHAFSMLIIKGGKGFEHITDDGMEITVTVDRPIRQMKLVGNDGSGSLKLLELTGEDPEHARFKGVKKGKFKDQKTGTEVDAWFVIIPTGGNPVKVESIIAYDDLGRRQTIPISESLLGSNGSGIQIGTRYPLTLTMNELGPAVKADGIIPWNAETVEVLTATGINSVFSPEDGKDDSSFQSWAAAYASYLNSGRSSASEEALKRFGDKDENGVWHFTINVDLDFTSYPSTGEVGQAIAVLEDELDCTGHTLRNLTLRNTVASGFIGELRNNGKLTNLHMEEVSVTGGTGASGLIAAKISGGRVENCIVRNMQVECDSAVGALAGEMAGGEAVDCRFVGRIIGKETAAGDKAGIVGIHTAGTLTGIDATNVAFGRKSE